MKTAMQDLKEDILESIESSKKAFKAIEDECTKEMVTECTELILRTIVQRIDSELLETERNQIMLAYSEGKLDSLKENLKSSTQYFDGRFT